MTSNRENKMIQDLYIHDITRIKVSEQTKKSGEEGTYKTPPYFYRKLVLTDERGDELTLHLFGHRETDLIIEFKDG